MVMVVVEVVEVEVGDTLGLRVGSRPPSSVLMSSSPRPLQKSEVQIQAEMLSDSREVREHSTWGWTGFSMLPRRMLVGKHSRMTELSVADFFQE